MIDGGCRKAKPSAGARKGAVQGVAKAVARTPLKKAPAGPCLEASELAAVMALPLRVTSKTPKRFSATRVTSVIMVTRKTGLPNCIPQLAMLPAFCTAMTIRAMTRKETSTPMQ